MSRFSKLSALIGTLGLSAAAIEPVAASGTPPNEGDEPAQPALGIAEDDVTKLVADAHAKGFATAQARMVTVMASDAGKAQPAAAIKLMAKSPDMSAEDVIETLAELTPPAPAAASGAAAIGADLNDTPKPKIDPATGKPGAAINDEDAIDPVAFWDGIQGTKNGVRVGGTGFGAAN